MKKKILFGILGVALFGVAIMLNVQNLKNTTAKARIKKDDDRGCCTSKEGECVWFVNGEDDFRCAGSFD